MLRECKISYPSLKTITVGGEGSEWYFSSSMRSTQSVILFGNRVTAGVSIKSYWVKVGPVSTIVFLKEADTQRHIQERRLCNERRKDCSDEAVSQEHQRASSSTRS